MSPAFTFMSSSLPSQDLPSALNLHPHVPVCPVSLPANYSCQKILESYRRPGWGKMVNFSAERGQEPTDPA